MNRYRFEKIENLAERVKALASESLYIYHETHYDRPLDESEIDAYSRLYVGESHAAHQREEEIKEIRKKLTEDLKALRRKLSIMMGEIRMGKRNSVGELYVVPTKNGWCEVFDQTGRFIETRPMKEQEMQLNLEIEAEKMDREPGPRKLVSGEE